VESETNNRQPHTSDNGVVANLELGEHSGGLGQSSQQGPGAEPLVQGPGAEPLVRGQGQSP